MAPKGNQSSNILRCPVSFHGKLVEFKGEPLPRKRVKKGTTGQQGILDKNPKPPNLAEPPRTLKGTAKHVSTRRRQTKRRTPASQVRFTRSARVRRHLPRWDPRPVASCRHGVWGLWGFWGFFTLWYLGNQKDQLQFGFPIPLAAAIGKE